MNTTIFTRIKRLISVQWDIKRIAKADRSQISWRSSTPQIRHDTIA